MNGYPKDTKDTKDTKGRLHLLFFFVASVAVVLSAFLGSLLGLDVSSLKGLGAGKGATFDAELSTEDGRLNINCGGGLPDGPHQQQLYGVLSSLFWPPRSVCWR